LSTLPPPSATPAIADVNHEVYATARRIASADVDIVLVGETGTGKDWLARYIHDHSGARGPFVAVNCPAIPETLAEAELFGVDAEAYTGATKSRAGRIESANGGTLYLDEIDSMPLSLQAKLLRVLQDRGVERVGSTVFRQLAFRVIVSTKVPLAKLVEDGKFRSDLYYRLSVVELALPVLRAQPARALELFWRYANHASTQFKLPADRQANPGIEAQILAHDWTGNIRELRAAAQRYALGFPAIRRARCRSPRVVLQTKKSVHPYCRA
jgi:DNA-binding NtrC family response regulator